VSSCRIARKAGVDGRLFGSVTNFDVADGLHALRASRSRKSAVRMPGGPLKTIGETQLEVALHSDVLATITVAVVIEQAKI
jgi:large subunit ribosomal protein L9